MIARATVPATILHGREAELKAMTAALDGARAGQGRLALVAGEAGIGKTALIAMATAIAQARGMLALRGHCYDLDAASPYGPWIELLRSYQPGNELPLLPPGLANADLLETLSGRDALFEQLAAFLQELAAATPVLLVLEDLHWSDQASLDLLRAVARRLSTVRLLIVASYRDNELTPRQPLHRVLPLLVRESHPLRIDPQPLGENAVRALVAERYSLPAADETRLVTHLQRYAEGNPFYLVELLRTLEHERLIAPSGDGWVVADLAPAPVPPLVRQLIEARVARLGDAGQRLLRIAAVIGLVIPPELWQAAGEEDDEVFSDTVDAARQANLIVETPDRGALQFAHALIHEALYDGLGLPRRRALHRRIAELLAEQADADPDDTAHHFLQAGDPRAADWLVRAALRAERRDAAWDAVTRYEQALPLLEQQGATDALVMLHIDLAESYRYIDPLKSLTHLDAADRIIQGSDDRVLALAIRWLRSRMRAFLGKNVMDEMRACVVLVEELSSDERGRLTQLCKLNGPSRSALAQALAFHGRYDEAIAEAEAALSDGAAKPSRELGGAYITLGLAHAATGRPEAARAAFAASREHYRSFGSDYMVSSTLKYEWMMVDEPYATDDLERRREIQEDYFRTMERMSSFAVYHGQRPLLPIFGPAMLEGRWNEARESALGYRGVYTWRVSALAALSELERRQGRFAAAWGRVRAAMPDGPETDLANIYFLHLLNVQRLAAALALDEGNDDLALAWIDAHDRWLAWSGCALDRATGLLLRARYHAARGDLPQARRWAEQALATAANPRQPLALLSAHRLLGGIAIVEGALAKAQEHLAAALVLADACAAPYERALTLIEQARLLIAEGRAGETTPLLEEAHAVCHRLGAAPALEQIAALAATPMAPAADPALANLTVREIEVLRLVAQGLSYAEVGEHLFISPRTVARHLQSIYSKLGLGSRAEAAAFAFAHGLVWPPVTRTPESMVSR